MHTLSAPSLTVQGSEDDIVARIGLQCGTGGGGGEGEKGGGGGDLVLHSQVLHTYWSLIMQTEAEVQEGEWETAPEQQNREAGTSKATL